MLKIFSSYNAIMCTELYLAALAVNNGLFMRFIVIHPLQQATAIGSERSTVRMWMWRIRWWNHYVLAFSCYAGRLISFETRRLSLHMNKVICSMMDCMHTSTYSKDFIHNMATYLVSIETIAFLHNRKIPACIYFSK